MSEGLIAEFVVDDPGGCPVVGAADAAGVPATDVTRAVATDEDGRLTEEFALPAGTGQLDLEEGADDLDRTASFDDRDVYRFTRDPTSACVCDQLEGVVGPVTDIHARDGHLAVTVHATTVEDVREAVADLRDAYDGVRLARLRRSTDEGASDLVLVDRAALTDRQREVLTTAHEMGYFDHPKGANATEVAEAVGISLSTFTEHLAAAQGKLLDAVLEE